MNKYKVDLEVRYAETGKRLSVWYVEAIAENEENAANGVLAWANSIEAADKLEMNILKVETLHKGMNCVITHYDEYYNYSEV